MKVNLVHEMLGLLRQPDATYEPAWEVDLLPETRDPQVSVENIRRLQKEGLTYLGLIAGPGGTLFLFQTGEMFLATGLGPNGGARTEAMALVASELGLGDQETLCQWYSDWYSAHEPSYVGPVPR